jgi:hypothetical protein
VTKIIEAAGFAVATTTAILELRKLLAAAISATASQESLLSLTKLLVGNGEASAFETGFVDITKNFAAQLNAIATIDFANAQVRKNLSGAQSATAQITRARLVSFPTFSKLALATSVSTIEAAASTIEVQFSVSANYIIASAVTADIVCGVSVASIQVDAVLEDIEMVYDIQQIYGIAA